MLALLEMPLVELGEQVQLAALFARGRVAAADELDQFIDVGILRIDVGSLEGSGEEAGLPVLRFLDRVSAGAHNDEAGEVLVFAAKAIGDPRSHRRADLAGFAAVHQQQGRLMVRHIRLHRSDEADVIDAFADVGIEVADFDAALAIFTELEHRRKGGAGFALGLVMGGDWLARIFLKQGFGVESIDVGGTAIHEQMDDPLGSPGKVRKLGRQWIQRANFGRR